MSAFVVIDISGNQLNDRDIDDADDDDDNDNREGSNKAEKNNLKGKKSNFQIKTNMPFKKKDDDHDVHDVHDYGCDSKSPKGMSNVAGNSSHLSENEEKTKNLQLTC